MPSAAQMPASTSSRKSPAQTESQPQSPNGKSTLLKPMGIAVAIGILLLGGFAVWNNGLKQRFIPTNFGVVEPGKIYRSGQISRYLMASTLEKYHIGLIVDLSYENTLDAQAERTAAAAMGVPRLNLRLGGNGTGNPDYYPQAIKAIVAANKQGIPVLVHCQSGAQRTGGIVAAYRILIQGKSEGDAFAEAETYGRSNAKLIPFIKQHLSEWKQKLADEHVHSD